MKELLQFSLVLVFQLIIKLLIQCTLFLKVAEQQLYLQDRKSWIHRAAADTAYVCKSLSFILRRMIQNELLKRSIKYF